MGIEISCNIGHRKSDNLTVLLGFNKYHADIKSFLLKEKNATKQEDFKNWYFLFLLDYDYNDINSVATPDKVQDTILQPSRSTQPLIFSQTQERGLHLLHSDYPKLMPDPLSHVIGNLVAIGSERHLRAQQKSGK